tara:strand:- start:5956 stop:6219 length:264 start_codon:yes stop_codon:yes gene_type:complete
VSAKAPDADTLSISVKDTGAGIPAESLNLIFEEFRQVEGSDTELKGTRLGLAITKKFAGLLGGIITVTSEVGSGSTCTIKLPRTYQP